MNYVWVKVRLAMDLHNKFRRWSFDHRTSMQAELADHVKELVESGVNKVVQVVKTPPVTVSVASNPAVEPKVMGAYVSETNQKVREIHNMIRDNNKQ